LKFILDARDDGFNQLFTSTESQRNQLKSTFKSLRKKLGSDGLDKGSIDQFFESLVNGILSQMFNTPIDLFIEDYIYHNYRELRPIQFASQYRIISNGVKATTDDNIKQYSPQAIVSKSKVLNLVLAFQFNELYGWDFTDDFKPTKDELRLATKLYNEYLEFRQDSKPGEEYDIIHNWSLDLGLNEYFELKDEKPTSSQEVSDAGESGSKEDGTDILSAIEDDPLDLNDDDLNKYKDEQTRKFIASEKAKGLNPAVMMYMVDALELFQDWSKEQIRNAAFEIAWIGTQGIDPNSDKQYTLKAIPQKKMSSQQLLAYYYISWILAEPEMHAKLGLPYDNEYESAKQLLKP
jgi:hypothetical protein